MKSLMILVVSLLASPVWGAEYFVSKAGSDANSCAAAQSLSTAKLTIASALTCEAAGDTIWINDGTYAETITSSQITAGTAITARTTVRAINNGQVTLLPTSGGQVVLMNARPFVAFIGLILDATNTTSNPMKLENGSSNVLLDHMEFRNSPAVGLLVQSSANGILQYSRSHHNGQVDTNLHHGMYLNTNSNDWVIEHNEFDHNTQMGVQIYVAPQRTIFRWNYLHDNCQKTGGGGSELFVAHIDHLIFGNLIVTTNATGVSCGVGITVDLTSPQRVKVQNNTAVCLAGLCATVSGSTQGYGINVRSSAVVDTVVQNNVTVGYGQGIRDVGTNTTLTTNLTSGTMSTLFTNHLGGDFTLKSGSAAINAGTSIGAPFCGSAPDQGAFEVPVVTAASINGNTLDTTLCSAAPPVQPLGTLTPACTGIGCGAPTNGGVSIVGGGIVRMTVNGISGGACAPSQTWTISASGANSDSALIGNRFNQPLHTVTNAAVDSSACTGSGGSAYPSGAIAYYKFDGNLNDSSGNGNNITSSANTTFATAKYGQGLQLTANADSFADTGLLSGHNPSTTHLVLAFGIRITTLSDRRSVAGTTLGTDQRFYVRIDSDNIWDFATQAVVSVLNTEFPVVTGDTHVCLKANPTTDTVTLYINGQAGTISGASVQNITSYTFPSSLRLGVPSGFGNTSSGNDILDEVLIYTSDVSCVDIYNAWQPPPISSMVVQAAHRWERTHRLGGSPESIGGLNATITSVAPGGAAVMAQYQCTGGDCGVLQPRFRYNVDGGAFNSVVPDTPTADGVSFWGASSHNEINGGVADGPLSGALSHTDGITLFTSAAIPTQTLLNNTSHTIRGIFRFNPDAAGKTICFKLYDQSGQPLASYTPSEGACVTVGGMSMGIQ